MHRTCAFFAVLLLCASVARADELHLKDGTKINGTIVGYEKDSFRVKTAYGYAVVEKSAVTSIRISHTVAKAAEENHPPVRPKPEPPAESKNSLPSGKPVEARKSKAEATTANKVPSPQPSAAERKPAPPPAAVPSPAPAAPQREAAPAPVPIREEIRGNFYINDTYGFSIYKPPDWRVIQGARAALPGAIVAMGTPDETTYLIMGLEPPGGTVESHLASTNERLAGMFDGFEPSKRQPVAVAGLTAYEYQFHGAANNQQWTGTIVLLPRGNTMFTIFGVTSATGDLVQIQQNVIWRTIASLHFSNP